MTLYNDKKFKKKLKKSLSESRYNHTLGVAYTAAALAMCHGCSIDKAYFAGLLHDCAKCIPNDKKLVLGKKHNLITNEAYHKYPDLFHAELGVVIAKAKYNVNDEDILNAIAYHTTGKPDMSLLEKIIYIADYIEPSRQSIPNLTKIRELAYKDIDAALLQILNQTITYVKSKKSDFLPITLEAYEYYKNKNSQNMNTERI